MNNETNNTFNNQQMNNQNNQQPMTMGNAMNGVPPIAQPVQPVQNMTMANAMNGVPSIAQPIQPEQPVMQQPINNNQPIQPNMGGQAPKKKNDMVFYIIVAVLVVIIVALLLFTVVNKKDDSSSNNNSTASSSDTSNNNNNSTSNTTNSKTTTTTKETFTFKNFQFEKPTGYTDVSDEDYPMFKNSSAVIALVEIYSGYTVEDFKGEEQYIIDNSNGDGTQLATYSYESINGLSSLIFRGVYTVDTTSLNYDFVIIQLGSYRVACFQILYKGTNEATYLDAAGKITASATYNGSTSFSNDSNLEKDEIGINNFELASFSNEINE